MLQLAQYRLAFVTIITISLIHNKCSYATRIEKKGSGDIFNILLSLYKLNPLKYSQVYRTFYDSIVTNKEKTQMDVPYGSSELVKLSKPDISEISVMENILHSSSKSKLKQTMEEPKYNIDDIDAENFNAIVPLPNQLKTDEEFGMANTVNSVITDNDLFLPESENFIDFNPTPIESNMQPASFLKPVENIDRENDIRLPESSNDVQFPPPINNDVIVF